MAEITTNLKVNNLEQTNVELQPTPVALSNASNVNLTVNTHANRLLVVPDQTANNHAYILPTPQRAGDNYQFIYTGPSSMQTNVVFRMPRGLTGEETLDESTYFRGSVDLLETRADNATSNAVVYANSVNSSNLNVVQPEAMDLRFVSANTSCYLVSGTITATQGSGAGFTQAFQNH